MKSLGGFFELELAKGKKKYHDTEICLSTGRGCLNLIMKTYLPAKIYVPYYSCDAVLEPIISNQVEYSFYEINDKLEPVEKIIPKDGEFLLLINYFGVKNTMIEKYIERMGERLIIDNTHGFFEKSYPGVISFNSARKFFGVPDGAYLYEPASINISGYGSNVDFRYDHLMHRLIGLQSIAYDEFLKYEASLNSDIKRMSLLSEILLSNIDYSNVAKIRKRNFNLYHESFKDFNLLKYLTLAAGIPFAYPLLLKEKIDKSKLSRQSIFIPTLWKDMLIRNQKGYDFEKFLTTNLLPLPVDHRNSEQDIKRIIQAIKEMIV